MGTLDGGAIMTVIRMSRSGRRGEAGFSLLEVLFAVFILGIGLIMVAAVFPVGADWTRQDWEESMGQVIGRNAVAIIQTKYTRGDLINVDSSIGVVGKSLVGTSLQALPNFAQRLPLSERAYGFGQLQAYPAANPLTAQYYWTALIRQVPSASADTPVADGLVPILQSKYEVFIFVMRKGASGQVFTSAGAGNPANWVEIPPTRDHWNTSGGGQSGTRLTSDGSGVPYLATMSWATFGAWGSSGTSQLQTGALFSTAGWMAVGQTSGTAFRLVNYASSPGNYTAVGRPPPSGQDSNVIIAPPADGTTVTPLVYVYQTTLQF